MTFRKMSRHCIPDKTLNCGSMAPSTDEFLHYIYVNSAVSLLLVLVNISFLSAIVLLSCSFFTRNRKNEVNFIENAKQQPGSELTKVTTQKDNGTSNGTKHDVIPTGATINEDRTNNEGKILGAPPLKNGAVHGSLQPGSNATSPSMTQRVLPLPPQDQPEFPPPTADWDHLYDSVNEIKERIAQQAQVPASSQIDTGTDGINKEDASSAISNAARENGETLERINPLYDSVENLKDQSSKQGPVSALTSPEPSQTDVESKTEEPKPEGKLDRESLYSVVWKKKQGNSPGNSAVKGALIPEVISQGTDGNQTLHMTGIPGQRPPARSTSSVKLDSALNRTNKRSLKYNKMPSPAVSVSILVDRDDPPPIPEKCFDIESEIQLPTNEEETASANESPA